MPGSAKLQAPSRRAAGRFAAGRRHRERAAGGPGDLLVGLGILAILLASELRRLRPPELAETHLVLDATAAGTMICLGAGTAFLLVRRSRRNSKGSRGRARARRRVPKPEAGWATRHDVADLVVRVPPGDRIVLGTYGRFLLAAECNQSVLLVGPTQSGKTSGLASPAILEWDGPVVATSVKSDLVRGTIDARRERGRVELYDPTGATGLASTGWSPLTTAMTWSGAKQLAAAFCSVARTDGGMEDAGFWYASAEKLLAPLLFAAATAGVSIADVVRWIDDEDLHEPLLALELAGVPDALRAARTSLAREDRQRSSVFATAETVVAGFSDPDVADSAAPAAPGIDPTALVDGSSGTLYCCAPAREQERLRPVFVALLRQVIDAAFERSSRAGRPLEPSLLVVLDEAANIAPLADLDTIVSTAAGHGIQLVTVWQDFAQIEGRYGRRWPTIVNNHRAKVLCPGSADPLTLDHMSALIGEDETQHESRTVGDDGRWSRTETASLRRVAPSAMLRRLRPGHGAVVYGSLPPAQIRLRPYFEHAGHRGRSARNAETATRDELRHSGDPESM
jgi:type IV secretion system protein VirD4